MLGTRVDLNLTEPVFAVCPKSTIYLLKSDQGELAKLWE